MMDTDFWTAGARRALNLAKRIAKQSGSAELEPMHLLGAFSQEESRATEILAEQGLSRSKLGELFPGMFEEFDSDSELSLGQSQNGLPSVEASWTVGRRESAPAGTIVPGEAFRLVLYEARRQARSAGRQAELGTEHLLWGLLIIESPAGELLRQYGLREEVLSEQVAEKSGQSIEPLDADFSLRPVEATTTDRTDTLRILDAAANRAREGLRVVEDYVRFTLDDAFLTELLKQCRHDLTEAMRSLDSQGLTFARDTEQDVGTGIQTASEGVRESLRNVVVANFKRVQEAARTLEEFGKTISPELAEAAGRLRYRVYTLEKAVLSVDTNRQRLAGCSLYLLVTEALCHHGAGPAIRESMAGGVGIVQVREKSLTDRELLAHARRVRQWTREAGVLLIMNDRPDLAVLADADGVHVGQDELPVHDVRRIVGPNRLIGVSTHTIQQARQAVIDGADYLGVGPVFPSTTKQFEEFAGLEFVRQAAEELACPWFAIGGINDDNLSEVLEAGATRIAVSGAICGAADHRQAAEQLKFRLPREAESVQQDPR